MIQFNLLPDVKLSYTKSQKTQRLVLTVALIASGASIGILVLLFATLGVQKAQLGSADEKINNLSEQVKNKPDLDKILTVQNQLNTLPGLHQEKPDATRLFSYLQQITPSNADIAEIEVDFALNRLSFSGKASSLEIVNKFTDTLKFTKYTVDGGDELKAFKSVVLDDATRDSKGANYKISVEFEPDLFDNTKKIVLKVPQNFTTTRSFTELPDAGLFNAPEENKDN